MEQFFLTCAFAFALAGAVKDVRGGRIPNWLTYSGILAALVFRGFLAGFPGLKAGVLGMLTGGGLFVILFFLGGMGGGDVKLMAAASAWAGSAQVVNLLIATVIAGGILAVLYMVFRRRVSEALLNTVELIRHHLTSGLKPHPELNVREPETMRVPYGVAIAIGTLYCLGRMSSWG